MLLTKSAIKYKYILVGKIPDKIYRKKAFIENILNNIFNSKTYFDELRNHC